MNQLALAFRLLRRDARSGELTILILALSIAVISTTAISLFAERLQKTMNLQGAEFLAADLVITSSSHIPQPWLDQAEQLSLKRAKTAEFSTVLIENDEMLLAGVKAVSKHYPLRGHLKTIEQDYLTETVHQQGPKVGNVWVEKRILSALKLAIGDLLNIGEKPLRISRIISYEPDKRGDLYSLSPRVMMNGYDLHATQVIQPGSHVHYFFQFSGAQADIVEFNHWVKPQLNPSQRLMDIHEDRPELGTAIKRAERYLGLASIVVIIIAGVAIAMAARRYTERHFNATAILRCLGLKQKQVLNLYITQFIILGCLTNIIACALGWLGQLYLFHLLRDLLPAEVAEPGLFAVFFGFFTGLAVLFGFALPPLLRLKNVSPLRALRHDLDPMPISSWLVYGLALLLVSIFVWRYTDDLKMTVGILGGGFAITALLGGLLYLGLHIWRRKQLRLPLHLRFASQNLTRSPSRSISQILGFSLTLVAMIISFTVRTDLLADWQKQLPDNAPNHFVMNIFPVQKNAFENSLKNQEIKEARFYPVIRGRLVRINDTPVQQIVSKESQGERAIHRDLSLTWSEAPPDDNKIVAGQWWTAENVQPGQVSIEEKLAKSLKVDLNDRLTFTVGSRQFDAVINSIRKVRWDTMKPNFYMVFSPGTLDQYASTHITSFFLPDAQKAYLNQLAKTFPGITILEVDLMLKQFKSILGQITAAIEYLLYFALLAGFTVLFAAIYSTLDQRIYEGALKRTLGAGKRLLQAVHLWEFALLGFIASLLAVIISETILFVLYHFVLHLDYAPHLAVWLIVLCTGTGAVALIGSWGVRNVVKHSPMRIFREL